MERPPQNRRPNREPSDRRAPTATFDPTGPPGSDQVVVDLVKGILIELPTAEQTPEYYLG